MYMSSGWQGSWQCISVGHLWKCDKWQCWWSYDSGGTDHIGCGYPQREELLHMHLAKCSVTVRPCRPQNQVPLLCNHRAVDNLFCLRCLRVSAASAHIVTSQSANVVEASIRVRLFGKLAVFVREVFRIRKSYNPITQVGNNVGKAQEVVMAFRAKTY